MQDLAINLLASVLAASAAWGIQVLLRYRRQARKRAFFGLKADASALLVVGRHASSSRPKSVHRDDVGALVELAAIVKESGGRSDVVGTDEVQAGLGGGTEFCVGGPTTNARMGAYLRTALPSVRVATWDETKDSLTLTVAGHTFDRVPHVADYVVLARVVVRNQPVFLLLGQTAISNRAAARYLDAEYASLWRQYRADRRFCLVLKVTEPEAFGPDLIELVADLTDEAFEPGAALPPGTPGALPGDPGVPAPRGVRALRRLPWRGRR